MRLDTDNGRASGTRVIHTTNSTDENGPIEPAELLTPTGKKLFRVSTHCDCFGGLELLVPASDENELKYIATKAFNALEGFLSEDADGVPGNQRLGRARDSVEGKTIRFERRPDCTTHMSESEPDPEAGASRSTPPPESGQKNYAVTIECDFKVRLIYEVSAVTPEAAASALEDKLAECSFVTEFAHLEDGKMDFVFCKRQETVHGTLDAVAVHEVSAPPSTELHKAAA